MADPTICRHCKRSDLYLKYDPKYPNKFLEGMQAFAPDEDRPHFMLCPENPYNKEKKQKQPQGGGLPKPPFKPLSEIPVGIGPLAGIEKDITEIKATLKIHTAMLEWIQEALIESGIKRKT